jgi:hypothetical protein
MNLTHGFEGYDMPERTDQQTREFENEERTGIESLAADPTQDNVFEERDASGTKPSATPDESEEGSRFGASVSLLPLLVVLVPPFVASFLVGSVPLLPDDLATAVGAAIGLLVGGFAAGLLGGARQYTEAALAGAIVGLLGGWTITGGFAVPTVLGGLLAGVVIALLGTYFGRDLRAGLTKDLS